MGTHPTATTGDPSCTRTSSTRSERATASSPRSTRAAAARPRRSASTASTKTPTPTRTRCSTSSTRCGPASSPARRSPASGSWAPSCSSRPWTARSTERGTAEYLWSKAGVVPFLKVDKGLADEADGVQLMKPMPDLDALLARAVDKGVFGTKMRSVIKMAESGRRPGHRRPAVRGRPPDPRRRPDADPRARGRHHQPAERPRPRRSCVMR